jgi:hypothetical protein
VVVGLNDAFSEGKDSSSARSSQTQGLWDITEDVRDVLAPTPDFCPRGERCSEEGFEADGVAQEVGQCELEDKVGQA